MKNINQRGFSAVEALLMLVIVGILGFTGWYVYHAKQVADKNLTSDNSATSTQKKKTSAQSTATDQYVGWKTASLQYEKMSFKYPSSWQISNTSKDENGTGGTANPGADSAILTSSTGLQVSINTGEVGVDTNGLTLGLSTSTPINTLGGSYYLVYYANKAQSTTEARGACLDNTASSSSIPSIASKNIQVAGMSDGSTGSTANLVCIGYQAVNGVTPVKPVTTFERDASYKDAKLIIESLRY